MALCRQMGMVLPVLHEMRKGGKGLIIGEFIVFYKLSGFFARAVGHAGLSGWGFVIGCQTTILNSKGK